MSKKRKIENVPIETGSLQNFPQVVSPSRTYSSRIKDGTQIRIGKGFSIKEIIAASIPLDLINQLVKKVPIDRRRKSLHDENVAFLGRMFRDLIEGREESLDKIKKIASKQKEQVKNLTKSAGISKREALMLVDAGVTTVEQFLEEDSKVLAKDLGIKVGELKKWKKEARKITIQEKLNEAIKELCQIKTLHPPQAKALASLGIVSLEILADEVPDELADELGYSEKAVSRWVDQAQKLLGKKGKKKDVERVEPVAKKGKKPHVEEMGLKDIVSKQDIRRLADVEVRSLDDLAHEDPEEMSSILGISKNITLKWINEARLLLGLGAISEEKHEKRDRIEEIEDLIVEDLKVSIPFDEEKVLEEEVGAEEKAEKPMKPKKAKKKRKAEKIKEMEEAMEDIKAVSVPAEDAKEIRKKSIALLIKIPGLGKASAEKMIDAGIKTIEDLIHASADELAEKSKISLKKIQVFIENATNL